MTMLFLSSFCYLLPSVHSNETSHHSYCFPVKSNMYFILWLLARLFLSFGFQQLIVMCQGVGFFVGIYRFRFVGILRYVG